MKNKTILSLMIIGIFFASSLVASNALAASNRCSNAQGQGKGFLRNIENKAKVLGMTIDQLKAEFNSGKTMDVILKAKNMTFEQFRTQLQQLNQSTKSNCNANGSCTFGYKK
jgi:hypothetical protein